MLKTTKKAIMSMTLALAMIVTLALATVVTPVKADSDLPDPNADVSITVHKISAVSESDRIGTGEAITDPASLGTPLAGATFTLYKVNAGYTVTGATTVAQAKANATIVSAKTTLADGIVSWNKTTDGIAVGYYVLEETTAPANHTAVADSIITLPYDVIGASGANSWNYNVHVYPKDVNTFKFTKVVENEQAAYNVGDTVSWRITGAIADELGVPVQIYKPADPDTSTPEWNNGKFIVNDALDARLTYVSSIVTATGGPSTLALTAGTHYTVDTTTTPGTVSWILTQEGRKYVTLGGAKAISVQLTTTINDTAIGGGDTISNGATFEVNAVTPHPIDPGQEDPEIKIAGLIIDKVDSVDANIKLSGATFKIATSQQNAIDGIYIKKDGTTVDLEVTTGDNPSTPEVELGYALFTDVSLGIDPEATTDTVFYLVETQAPTGYLKHAGPIQATIFVANEGVGSVIVRNTLVGGQPHEDNEYPIFALPKTGGMGTVIFTVAGIALVVCAFFLIFISRRKKDEEK